MVKKLDTGEVWCGTGMLYLYTNPIVHSIMNQCIKLSGKLKRKELRNIFSTRWIEGN